MDVSYHTEAQTNFSVAIQVSVPQAQSICICVIVLCMPKQLLVIYSA